MSTNADDFLVAFTRIEGHLRSVLSKAKVAIPATERSSSWRTATFRTLLNAARPHRKQIEQRAPELERFAEIRNLLSHNRDSNGHYPVQPSDTVTSEITRLAAQLTDPPRVDRLRGKVSTVRSDDHVRDALVLMREGGFSQLPVYAAGADWQFAGLLTANTLANWLADAAVSDGILDLHPLPISTVLACTEDENHVAFIEPQKPLDSVMQQFQQAQEAGRRLEAVLITADGTRDRKPLGIITVHDLGKVHQLLTS